MRSPAAFAQGPEQPERPEHEGGLYGRCRSMNARTPMVIVSTSA